MRRLSLIGVIAAFSVASFALGAGTRATLALFTDRESSASTFGSAACFTDDVGAPTVDSAVISKTVPYLAGSIRQGSAYHVYANVTALLGTVSRVTADVRALTPGEYIAPLSAGSYSIGGVSYGFRSAQLVAQSPMAEGAYNYSISVADDGMRCRTASSTVTIDNTPPSGTNVEPINNGGGGGWGNPEPGDVIEFSFSERIDPESVSTGWTGASARNVVVRITENGSNDMLTVWDATNTTQLPLGAVDLAQDYVAATVTFGASGTPSTMTQSGTTISVTLGTQAGTTNKVTSSATAVWTPSSAATDAAGNGCSTAPVNESGVYDRNF